jgi:hypothetical protein
MPRQQYHPPCWNSRLVSPWWNYSNDKIVLTPHWPGTSKATWLLQFQRSPTTKLFSLASQKRQATKYGLSGNLGVRTLPLDHVIILNSEWGFPVLSFPDKPCVGEKSGDIFVSIFTGEFRRGAHTGYSFRTLVRDFRRGFDTRWGEFLN